MATDLMTMLDQDDDRSPFDRLRHVRDGGAEYWSARELADVLEYDQWRNFDSAVDRARRAIANQQGVDAAENHIAGASKMVTVGSGARRAVYDWHLTRFGAYMVVMNGDPRKREIAAAQAYFAVKTREAETATPTQGVDLMSPESILTLAQRLVDTTHRAEQAEAQALESGAELLELTPKAAGWETFLSTEGDYSVNEAAKLLTRDHGIHTGEKRLRALLEEWGWIYRHSGQPRAMQTQVDCGRLTERARFHYHPVTGERVADTPQVRVTPKGLEAIWRRMTRGTLLEAAS